jgi:hypothetical protein
MSDCDSTYKVAAGVVLHCSQHLGSVRRWRHSARYLGQRWYWTTAEADRQVKANTPHTEGND